MQCPKCYFQSNAEEFDLKIKKKKKRELEDTWVKTSIYRIRVRICPKCKSKFNVGHPILKRIEKIVSKPFYLSEDLAKEAKFLIKKKKSFLISDIQKLFKIPIPNKAEKKIKAIALCGLLKIKIYPSTPKKVSFKKFIFINNAEQIILKALNEKSLELLYSEKIQKIHNLLKNQKKQCNKAQSYLISNIIEKQKGKLEFYDYKYNRRILPSKFYSKYETILEILILLLEIIENQEILTTKQLVERLQIDLKDLNQVKPSLIGILGNKLLYFNILASNNQLFLESNSIPIELSKDIAEFEINLRKYIISELVKYYNSIKNAFLNGIPQEIKKNRNKFDKCRAEKQLRKQLENNARLDSSNISTNLLNLYDHSGICSNELFEHFMQQLNFFHLILLIDFHWQMIFKFSFANMNKNEAINRLNVIKDARNTDAHRKYKITEISKVIESLFKFAQKIK